MDIPLGIVDIVVLIAATAASILIGLLVAGKNNSVESYLLGDRNLPWWAILGSIVATETSTATVLSIPGLGYSESGFKFLQLALGFAIGRTLVVTVLLPKYFQGSIVSAYEILQHRFGPTITRAASVLFLITRNLGDGLRLFLAAMLLQKLVGWPLIPSAIAIGAITMIYTFLGGMRSVVWNDCIQLIIYLAGSIAAAGFLFWQLPNGWSSVSDYIASTGKANWIDTRWDLSNPYTLYAGIIGGAFLSLGSHGTDQMMVQRYLSARSERQAAVAILSSGLFVFLQFALFLFIGILLAIFYSPDAANPQRLLPDGIRNDEVFAHFIVHHFPMNTGLIGLMLAAILAATMSTLSSSLSASASSAYSDLWLPSQKNSPDESKRMRFTRIATICFGLLQIAIGVWANSFSRSVVDNALTIASFSAGPLLGWFGLGILFPKIRQTPALVGGTTALALLLTIQYVLPLFGPRIAYPWFPLIGSVTTMFVANIIDKYLSSQSTPTN